MSPRLVANCSLVLVLAMMLAGCAPPAASPTAAVQPTSPPAAAPTTAATEATAAPSTDADPEPTVAPQPVTLRFASWQWGEPGFGDFYREAYQAFVAENPHITVEEYALPVNQYFDQMLTQVQTGSPADLIMLRASLYPQYVAMGALEPLSAKMTDETDILERWDPAQTTDLMVDGEMYGLLVMSRSFQMVYNRNELEAVGIAAVPETPEEFFEAAVALTRVDPATGEQKYGYKFSTSVNDFGFYEDIMLWVNCFGGNFARDGQVTANDPATVQGLTFLKRMYDAQVTPLGIPFSEAQQRIVSGNLAMLHGGPFIYPFLEAIDAEKVQDIGFAGTPCPNHTSTGGPQNVLVIPAQAQNKDAAWEYMKFIARPEWQERFPELTFSLPGMQGALGDEFREQYPWFELFDRAQPYAISIAPPGFEVYQSEWQRLVGEKVEAMFLNNLPPEQVAEDIQATLEEFVARAGN
jgi:multiple sugar transport system substrate-binding protein